MAYHQPLFHKVLLNVYSGYYSLSATYFALNRAFPSWRLELCITIKWNL